MLVMLVSVFPMAAMTHEAEPEDALVAVIETELQEQPSEFLELEAIGSLPIELAERPFERRNARNLEGGFELKADQAISRDARNDAYTDGQSQSMNNYLYFHVGGFLTQPFSWAFLPVEVWPDEILQVQMDVPNDPNVDYDLYFDLITNNEWEEVASSTLRTFINGSDGTLSESTGWINDTGSIQVIAVVVEATNGFSTTQPFTFHIAMTTDFSDYEADSIFAPRALTLDTNQSGRLDTRVDSDWFSFTATSGISVVNISLDATSKAAGHVVELYTLNNRQAIRVPIDGAGMANVTPGTYFVRVDTRMLPVTGMDYGLTVAPAHVPPPPVITGVVVNPEFVLQIPRGTTRQFTATVQGPNSPPQNVEWSLIGNSSVDTTIDANGLLRVAVSESAPLFTVKATSASDPNRYGLAFVTSQGHVVGNNNRQTAHNLGRWSATALNATTLLRNNVNTTYYSNVVDTVAYYTFTARPGDRFYIRVPYGLTGNGRTLELLNASGNLLRANDRVVDRGTVGAFIYVEYEVPGSGTNNITFFIRITRGNGTGTVNFAPAFRELFRNGSGTFNFSGTATNPGNSSLNPIGTNSTELRLDLRNNANIPERAVVRSVTTRSTMSPSQGNVRHHIANDGRWNQSIVSSATSGSYNISLSDGYYARAIWTFRYNVLATAPSSMSNVSITINYEFNVSLPYRDRLS
jgi:hypothetical protein